MKNALGSGVAGTSNKDAFVQIPDPGQDRPPWKQVAVIATLGFVVGVAWPRLAGVRLGPSLPESSSASAAPSAPLAAVPAEGASTPGSAPVAAAAVPSAGAGPEASSVASSVAATHGSAPNVSVSPGTVLSCKTTDGETLKGAEACGGVPGLDAVISSRLRKLAECPDAAEATGRLTLVLRVDLARGLLTIDLGHGQSVASPDLLLACARTELSGAPIASLAHENPRYTVSYAVTFGGPARPAAAGSGSAPERSESGDTGGAAQVAWDVAIVRDSPKTGKVLARLPRGTAVRLGAMKDGWFPVRYGDGFGGEGWVYRGAVGR